ncbi:hypothetical protein [Luteithermobacter gelatinilyticus]|uniref:hypothetical protein n=1 Tax=Luteithermobacter gelatinilyticus TaxID=2582913 RepID=UPI0011071A16|nr:hypothetical protein [Luteithermobacter gelatinilyticus]
MLKKCIDFKGLSIATRQNAVLNLTQHQVTDDQRNGEIPVIEIYDPVGSGSGLGTGLGKQVVNLLTFTAIPSKRELKDRARELADIAAGQGCAYAMIGGAPYLMPHLEKALKLRGIKPLYAFSRRESVEVKNPDGTVTKTNRFKHLGFVQA